MNQPGHPPYLLHVGMFKAAIQKLGSDKQYEKLEDDIDSFRMFGCYAQTELGHGSDVSSLQTTATLDLATDEFVIHTPTITASKFWPGGLGLWANHALVFARCIVQGNDYGVAPFLVQIRSIDTHLPLKGVQVGDIGPKFGYQGVDNGWLIFDHVRIPRTNMLSRYAYISKDGDFELRGNPKGIYQTMVEIRWQIIAQAGHYLRRALVIGTRYAVCRRQFANIEGSKAERKLLDYQAHMFKLGPLVAQSYIMCTVGVKLHEWRKIMNDEIKENKFTKLNLMHHFTSGLKSIYSQLCYDGIECVRVNCGGAGYSVWSGLPQIFFDQSPVPVYEGDNTVMAQQAFNYILKIITSAQKGKPIKDSLLQYVLDLDSIVKIKSQANDVNSFINLGHLLQALQVRAAFHIKTTVTKFTESTEKKKVKLNDLFAIDILSAMRMHMLYQSCLIFINQVESQKLSPVLKNLMNLLAQVFALWTLQQDSTALYETGFFGKNAKNLLMDSMKRALTELRPHMIPLVELNNDEFSDMSYLSAIGNKYGDIYEAQLQRAMNSRLNKTPKPDYWDSLVKPLIGRANENAKL